LLSISLIFLRFVAYTEKPVTNVVFVLSQISRKF
jgi:hypothetical protein